MSDSPIVINGVQMSFTSEELVKVLMIMKKSLTQAEESLEHEDEEKILEQLLNTLKQT